MSEKKTFSFQVTQGQRDIIDEAVEKAKDVYSTDLKNVAAFSIFFNWLENASDEDDKAEVIQTDIPLHLEDLCELGFLQKIIDPKTGILLWHCLKNQRPDGKGKPILMADGRDRQSITKLCEACKLGFVWHEQRSKLGKTMAAFQRFGDMELSVEVNSCIHPANNAIQVNLGDSGNFYCKLKEDRVTIQRTCKPNNCEYLYRASAPIFMKETAAYKEVTKQLTDQGA